MRNIKNILVATALDPASDDVVRGAAALAELTGAQLHLLHTYEFDSTPYGETVPAKTFQDRINQIERALDEQIRRTTRGSGDVKIGSKEVMIYTAYKAILERAEIVKADLIVIGRHRQGHKGPEFLGSTADHVVRDAKAPCLVLHGPLKAPLERVLVPIDLSEPALHALDVALGWSLSLGPKGNPPEIIVLHIIPQVYSSGSVPLDMAELAGRIHHEIEAAEEREETPAEVEVREEVRWNDDAVTEILDFIEQEDVDLTVLGTHGHGLLKRALIGSVASGVARRSARPVLLVPPSLWQEE